jgi:hypothetical protein
MTAIGSRQSAVGEALTKAARDVLAERRRQIDVEGFDAAHDDVHVDGELAGAAAAYAAYRSQVSPSIMMGDDIIRSLWPWAAEWWKPMDRRHDLVRAAALLIAEIERIDRADERRWAEECGE